MKPIFLRMKAFGPFLKEQKVDFSAFEKSGLFLISGNTGAGKTTILDAMTYALYGRSSGGTRGNFISMRCQNAAPGDITEVEFIFSIRGKKYKFVRSVRMARKNYIAEHDALYMTDDGSFMPFFENPTQKNVESKAEELMGLSYEQFRQVIILPQGQFEKLLTAKSEEKEDILTNLFGADIWQKAAENMTEKVNEKRRYLDGLNAEINRVFKEYGVENTQEMCELLKSDEDKYKAEIKALAENEENLKKLRKKFEEETALSEKFAVLETNEKRLENLNSRKNDIEEKQKCIKNAEKAVGLKSEYESMKKAKDALKLREKNFGDCGKRLLDAEKLLKEAEETLNILKKVNIEEKKQTLAQTEEKCKEAAALKSELKNTEKELEVYTKKERRYTAENAEIKSERLKSEREQARLFGEYAKMFDEYISGIGGELAAELKENEPCPVCGSLHHPSPAKKSETTVTRNDIDGEKAKIDSAAKKTEDINGRLAENEEKLKNISAQLMQYTAEQKQIKLQLEKNEFSESDGAELTRLKEEIVNYESERSESEKAYASASNAFAATSEAYKTAEKEHKAAKKEYNANKFEELLKNTDFADEQEFVEYLNTDIEELKSETQAWFIETESCLHNIEKVRREIGEKSKPDIERTREEAERLDGEIKTEQLNAGLLKERVGKLKTALNNTEKSAAEYEAEDLKWKENNLFLKRVRGDSGIGLRRYALGIMLSEVISEANRLLENVYGGRYRLYRSASLSKREKSGLEFEVSDSQTSGKRDVTSLSGGEKFLVSLALSIGLLTSLQSQMGGIRPEAMFIDEGFGTLDENSAADAVSLLCVMKNSAAVVGIISHVDFLKENITSGIEVIKKDVGSELKMNI